MSGEAALTLRGGEMRNTKVSYFPGTIVGLRLRLLSNFTIPDANIEG